MSTDGAVSERISLTMRTRWFSEFRTTSGVLVMFDVVGERTTFGRLCTLIGQIGGVEFADWKIPVRYAGPARFRFRGQDFTIAMEHQDYRVTAVDPSASPSRASELLSQLKERLNKRSDPVTTHRFSM